MNKWLFQRILLCFGFLLCFHFVSASTPTWTIEPITPTKINLSPSGQARVKYIVTNRSSQTHRLAMTAIQGVTQLTSPPGDCPALFTLASQQSCVLDLVINGASLTTDIIGGPIVCQDHNPLQCYRPSAANSLNITLNRSSHTVGGIVTGLTGGTLILANNGTDLLSVFSSGSFTFQNSIPVGGVYHVTVQTQPAGLTCSVSNGTGIMGNTDITDVSVVCSANAFTVGGTVAGLVGTVVLQNNNTDSLIVNSNGSFTFPTPVAQGSLYHVTIQTQPVGQTCTVANAIGVIGNANVTSVRVNCSANAFTVGGTVSGLVSGTVSLRLNGETPLPISANGPYTFPTPVAQGSIYVVTIASQPVGQNCTLANNFGLMGGANVTNVLVTCSPIQNTVGGTLSGLIGTVVLQNNGADNLSLSTDGPFTFSTPVTIGSPYNVTVLTQPAGQTCTVSNGAGIMGLTSVTNVEVVCSANTYTIGGTVSGLSGSVTLLRNGQESLVVNANGIFTFPTPVAEGSFYLVTIQTQPVGQTCSISNNFGRVGTTNVTNIVVVCAAQAHTVGGTLSGLTGGTIVLQNNYSDNLALSANGGFTFSTPVAEGSTYLVTVQTQPIGQICTVANGSGTMGASNVTNVLVTCTAGQTQVFANSGVVPVSAGNGSITITNVGAYTALNVHAVLPAGWSQVTQDATGCVAVAPSGTCQLLFSSPVPFVAQEVGIVGDNATLVIPHNQFFPPALAFSIDSYLVYSVDSASTASVIGVADTGQFAWDSACCQLTNANSLVDGSYLNLLGNTYQIISGLNAIGTQTLTGGNAAASCYNIAADNTGAVPNGTWFLPSVCQLAIAPGTGCVPGFPNISSLNLLGFGDISGLYWSSTEISLSTAYLIAFNSFGDDPYASVFGKAVSDINVRCARSIGY